MSAKVINIDELPDDAAITVPQTAQLFRVTDVSIWRWLKSGTLPSFKIGNSRRIRVGDVRRVMQGVTA